MISEIGSTRCVVGRHQPLDQHGLELASKRVGVVQEGPRHQGRDVARHVSECCVKHEPVDGLVSERTEACKCRYGEDAAQQRDGGAQSLHDADGIELVLCKLTHDGWPAASTPPPNARYTRSRDVNVAAIGARLEPICLGMIDRAGDALEVGDAW